jgi:hypothetical protein
MSRDVGTHEMTPADATSTFPLPVRWRAELPWFCWVRDAPVPDGPQIVARCGEAVVAFDADSGEIRWRTALGILPGDGEFFAQVGNVFVTEGRRPSDAKSSFYAVSTRGELLWRVDVPTVIPRGHVIAHHGDLLVVGTVPEEGTQLWQIDARLGRIRETRPLPEGGSMLAAVNGEILIAGKSASPGAAGLYRMSLDGERLEVLLREPVWNVIKDGDVIVTASRVSDHAGYTIRVHDAATNEIRWVADAVSGVVALDRDGVIHAAGSGEGSVPVLRDVRTGEERWRGRESARPPMNLSIAGGLVFVLEPTALSLYDRDHGTFVGETLGMFGYSAAVQGRSVYLGERQAVVCASLDR